MNDLIVKDNIEIEDLIYEVRGKQVMLDSDIAKVYNIETKILNQTVKRNINRFPNDFCFQLTKEEYDYLRSQIVTSNKNARGGTRYLPYAFTEYGIIMLSGLLKSPVAAEVNKMIVRAFVAMKMYINTNLIEQKYINNLVLEHDNKINLILDKLSTKENNNHIFYEGQIYDAYSLLINILSKAKEEIIIIDNYAGRELFDITRNINVNIKIYTKNIDDISKKKYEKEYSNIEIITTNIFHDRFIIIDNKKLYHSGASFKDIGKKCFAISKIDDDLLFQELLNIIKGEIN